jgi:hypothetical protein
MPGSRTIIVFAVACLIGCGGDGSAIRHLVKVTGTVALDGQPLKGGTISFVTDRKGSINAAGDIDNSGRYSLGTQRAGDGVLPGLYKIRIESWATPPKMDETGTEPGKSAIPERYNLIGTSGLTAKVKAAPPSQTFDFNLTSN